MTTHNLVLLRHGESIWNRENRFSGWTDVPLSEAGEREAKEGGRLLREEGFALLPGRSGGGRGMHPIRLI